MLTLQRRRASVSRWPLQGNRSNEHICSTTCITVRRQISALRPSCKQRVKGQRPYPGWLVEDVPARPYGRQANATRQQEWHHAHPSISTNVGRQEVWVSASLEQALGLAQVVSHKCILQCRAHRRCRRRHDRRREVCALLAVPSRAASADERVAARRPSTCPLPSVFDGPAGRVGHTHTRASFEYLSPQ